MDLLKAATESPNLQVNHDIKKVHFYLFRVQYRGYYDTIISFCNASCIAEIFLQQVR